jgi:RNA polymerase primary sigma factor
MNTYFNKIEAIDSLNYALSLIPEKEKYAIVCHMVLGFTLDEVGQTLGVSRERVRQMEARGIRRLRHPDKLQYIEEALQAIS